MAKPKRALFGDKYPADELKKIGIEIEFTPKSEFLVGSTYELPCQVKTSMRDISAVGAFTYINGKGRFTNVKIGRYCSIAENVAIGYPEHPIEWLSTSPLLYIRPGWASVVGDWKRLDHTTTKETTIENDVWIGVGAFIRTGVTIGTGAIIGAHAVVTKDVPPYSIVVGNPGKIIRTRVPGHHINELLKTRWWEFSPPQLSGCPFDNPQGSIEFIKKIRESGEKPYFPTKLVITSEGAVLTSPNTQPMANGSS